jgi:exonuclease III
MNALSWNCQGLGQPWAVQELTRLIREYCPNCVFLSETRQHKERVSNLQFRIGFQHSFIVDRVGKGGGLGLYWDDSLKIDIMSYGLHFIDCLIWSCDLNKR